jgi:hypothetical protein
VATIKNSSGIGLAIPAETLRKDFLGRVGTIHATAAGEKGVDVEVGLIDPLGKLKSPRLQYVASSLVKGDWKKLKSLEEVSGVKKILLVVEKQIATAKLHLDRPDPNGEVLMQVVYSTAAGKEARSKIVLNEIDSTVNAAKRSKTLSPPQKEVAGKPIIVRPWGDFPGKIGLPVKEVTDKVTASNSSHTTDKINPGKIYVDGDTDSAGQSFPIERQQVPDKGTLIGMEVGFSNAVAAFVPIYRTPKGEIRGAALGSYFVQKILVKAKTGYAVGGILARCGLFLDGFCLVYMKTKTDGTLDVNDAYCSDWCGLYSGGPLLIGGTGAPIVGVIAGFNGAHNVNGIGLMFRPLGDGESPPNPFPDAPQRNRPRPRPAPGVIYPSPEVLANEERSNPARTSLPIVPWPIFGNGDTEIIGGRGGPVRYPAPEGALLIGFECGTVRANPSVVSLTPIYRTAKGEERGQPHGKYFERKLIAKAHSGYAVGGLVIRDDGFYLIYMKMKADGTLDLADTQRSEWIGGYRGGAPILLGGTGAPVIGFLTTGAANDRSFGVGLILKRN